MDKSVYGHYKRVDTDNLPSTGKRIQGINTAGATNVHECAHICDKATGVGFDPFSVALLQTLTCSAIVFDEQSPACYLSYVQRADEAAAVASTGAVWWDRQH